MEYLKKSLVITYTWLVITFQKRAVRTNLHTNKEEDLMWVKNLCGENNGTPLHYSCLENPMDGGAWKAAVHRVAEGQTRLSDFAFTFHFHALEKEMANHSSVLAWRIPGTGEPGGLPSMGSHRVGHNWSGSSSSRCAFKFCLFLTIIALFVSKKKV